MSQDVPNLTTKQVRAIEALLTEKDIQTAAAKVGIDRKTITRWLALPEFSDALKKAEKETIDVAARRLAGLSSQALEVLADVMNPTSLLHPGVASVRLKAAQITLEQIKHFSTLSGQEERLAAIEEMLKNEPK